MQVQNLETQLKNLTSDLNSAQMRLSRAADLVAAKYSQLDSVESEIDQIRQVKKMEKSVQPDAPGDDLKRLLEFKIGYKKQLNKQSVLLETARDRAYRKLKKLKKNYEMDKMTLEIQIRQSAEFRIRKCLTCEKDFESDGPYNRMCDYCNEKS